MLTAPLSFVCAIPAAFIFVPVSIWSNLQLYQHRNETFMQKRSLPIVFGLNGAFIAMMVCYPLCPIVFFNCPPAVSSMAFILAFVAWWILLLFLNLRNWLIYFKSHWSYKTVQLQWQQIINPNIKNQKNWFIDNRNKYGKLSGVLKLFLFFHFIGCIISMIGAYCCFTGYSTNGPNTSAAIGIPLIIVSLSIPIMFYTVILCKTPTFASCHVYIHWENEIQSKLLVLALIAFLLGLIAAEIVGFYLASSVLIPAMCFIFFVMNYISTFSLMKKNMRPMQEKEDDDDDDVDIQLNDILAHKRAVHLFMVYLTTEFSIECLLSFIEIAQFEKYISDTMRMKGGGRLMDISIRFETVITHSNVPQSLILEHTESMSPTLHVKTMADKRLYDAKMKAHKLYNKYIRVDSEFEINISGLVRKKLKDALHDKTQLIASNVTLADLLMLFEPSKCEMKRLLRYSYFRFKHRREFERVVKLFAHKNNKNDKHHQDKNVDGVEIIYANEDKPQTDEQPQTIIAMGVNIEDDGEDEDGLQIVYDYNDDDLESSSDNKHCEDAQCNKSIAAKILSLQDAISKSGTPQGYMNVDA